MRGNNIFQAIILSLKTVFLPFSINFTDAFYRFNIISTTVIIIRRNFILMNLGLI